MERESTKVWELSFVVPADHGKQEFALSLPLLVGGILYWPTIAGFLSLHYKGKYEIWELISEMCQEWISSISRWLLKRIGAIWNDGPLQI